MNPLPFPFLFFLIAFSLLFSASFGEDSHRAKKQIATTSVKKEKIFTQEDYELFEEKARHDDELDEINEVKRHRNKDEK